MTFQNIYDFINWIVLNRYQYDYTGDKEGIILENNKIIYTFMFDQSDNSITVKDYWNR